MKNKKLGAWGEQFAAEYLKAQGMQILMQNYRTPYGELDLIAREGDCLVLAEVKTRSSRAYGSPLEAVTPVKQQYLRRAASLYLKEHPFSGEVRFDVIAILKEPGRRAEVEHIQGAF